MNPNDTLTIATDGSSSNRPVSGWAWIAEDGNYSAGTIPTGTILVAELRGILEALRSAPVARSVRILTDSRPALVLVNETLEMGVIRDRSGIRGAKDAAHALHHIALLASRRAVSFEWVKGHSDHPLNNAADRLAYQARRCAQLGGNPADLGVIYNRIVTESIADLHHAR
ncbi:hypothetical protein E3T37_00670 [Cryobacterium sp. TMT2-10]|uniref:ribonuclease HI n=1 Tax=Cryobacterium sp. TMT2-10 TaxID=1259244 RepID=UPI00106C642B|nr:RNase H family protein [Cryobacterium sp. TMT2-10]TFD43812.1 hypothetical protein E3T37_00670 [Cryobacterium sp. TMT2-10]